MPINYASPTPDHRTQFCSRCAHVTAERDEARNERDELGVLLDEVAELVHDGLDADGRTHYGALYAIERRLLDQAPAAYRQHLDDYRNGGAL